jgi:hypothetical protein
MSNSAGRGKGRDRLTHDTGTPGKRVRAPLPAQFVPLRKRELDYFPASSASTLRASP